MRVWVITADTWWNIIASKANRLAFYRKKRSCILHIDISHAFHYRYRLFISSHKACYKLSGILLSELQASWAMHTTHNESGMRHKKCENALCRNRFRVTCSILGRRAVGNKHKRKGIHFAAKISCSIWMEKDVGRKLEKKRKTFTYNIWII
jgi:hypothetical protein